MVCVQVGVATAGAAPRVPPCASGEVDRQSSSFSEVDQHHPCPFGSTGSPGACEVSTKLPCTAPVAKLL